jgi:nicotinamidase-related amidase
MRTSTLLSIFVGAAAAQNVSEESVKFGKHYAVLNLDLINAIVTPIAASKDGRKFIKNTAKWIDAVHAVEPSPLSIFTRIYFSSDLKPELKANSGFADLVEGITTEDDNSTAIYPDFDVKQDMGDIILGKTRYYAGDGNALEEILRAQKIKTVVISGVRTSGVVLSTVYRLFDLDYKMLVFLEARSLLPQSYMLPQLCDFRQHHRAGEANDPSGDSPGHNPQDAGSSNHP